MKERLLTVLKKWYDGDRVMMYGAYAYICPDTWKDDLLDEDEKNDVEFINAVEKEVLTY